MTLRMSQLSGADTELYQIAFTFILKRLASQSALNWAIALNRRQFAQRVAVAEALRYRDNESLREPWKTAWRFVLESWDDQRSQLDDDSYELHHILRELKHGNESRYLQSALVEVVRPRLKAEVRREDIQPPKKKNGKRRHWQVAYFSIDSGSALRHDELAVVASCNAPFLRSLASSLEHSIHRGMDIARSLDWDGRTQLWRLGSLHRVYQVPSQHTGRAIDEPDAYHTGMAPAVKLWHATLESAFRHDPSIAETEILRLSNSNDFIGRRMAAALMRHEQFATTSTVEKYIASLSQTEFWDLTRYPEISELRAVRFSGLSTASQKKILHKIIRMPPRSMWQKDSRFDVPADQARYAVREMNRIASLGTALPDFASAWVRSQTERFDLELTAVVLDDGFPTGPRVSVRGKRPDPSLDPMKDVERLHKLQRDLSAPGDGWDSDPAARATDWINSSRNDAIVFEELEQLGASSSAYPDIWSRFGWANHRGNYKTEDGPDGAIAWCSRVLQMIVQLDAPALRFASDGLAYWMNSWKDIVVNDEFFARAWEAVWLAALDRMNGEGDGSSDETNLDVPPTQNETGNPLVVDTLNNSVGNLVAILFDAMPDRLDGTNPFKPGTDIARIQSRLEDLRLTAPQSQAWLIASHTLARQTSYLHAADPAWVTTILLAPLDVDTRRSISLWKPISQSAYSQGVIASIGRSMASHASSQYLDRQTKVSLLLALSGDVLNSFVDGRDASISPNLLTQALRVTDSEVRSQAAQFMQQFVASARNDQCPLSAEELFRRGALPFLESVWPQERSLVTEGVSSALADLPATSGSAFCEAVAAIERFLVPFQCWTMSSYGLSDDMDSPRAFQAVDGAEKAHALLRLLDRTIGSGERDVVPQGLAATLDRIRSLDPQLSRRDEFKRLEAQARR